MTTICVSGRMFLLVLAHLGCPVRSPESHKTVVCMCVGVPKQNMQQVSSQQTHAHTQLFYGSMDFVQDNPGEPVPEETFTHSHLSWSSIVPYLLHPPNMIPRILPVQSTCLTVFFHNLSPSFLWSISWPGTLLFILHTFLHPIICLLFATHAHTIATCFAVVSRLCHLTLVSQPFTWNSVL